MGGDGVGGYTGAGIKDVGIRGFNQAGAFGLKLAGVVHGRVENCYIQKNYDNIVTDDTTPPTVVTIANTESRDATRYGGYLTSGTGITLEPGTVFETNGSSGLYVTGAGTVNMLSLKNVWFENNNTTTAGRQLVIKGTGTGASSLGGVSLYDNYFNNGGAACIGNAEFAYISGLVAIGNAWALAVYTPDVTFGLGVSYPFLFRNDPSATYTVGYMDVLTADQVNFMYNNRDITRRNWRKMASHFLPR